MVDLIERGERRHEQCRFGTLTPAWQYDLHRETPTVLPLCTFTPSQDVPPALTRAWGGAVEYDRDCAVCDAYSPLKARATQEGQR